MHSPIGIGESLSFRLLMLTVTYTGHVSHRMISEANKITNAPATYKM